MWPYEEKERWIKIYERRLKGEIDQFPSNFWKKNGREKALALLRHYIKTNDIEPSELPNLNNRQLLRDARLYTPLKNIFDGDSADYFVAAFQELSHDQFRFSSNTKIDWDKVEELRSKNCTVRAIAEHLGCNTTTLRERAKKNGLDLELPEDAPAIQGSVEEVLFFWKQVDRVLNEEITLEMLVETLEDENNWSYNKTKRYLNRFGIKKEIGRQNTSLRRITEIDNPDDLNKSEKKVYENIDGLKKLYGYGADFIRNDSVLIEAKTTASSQTLPKSILQLLMAEDFLEKRYGEIKEKQVYCLKTSIGKNKESSMRRLLNHFGVSLFVFDEEDDSFIDW